MKLSELINYLACPDDQGTLKYETNALITCVLCGRKFEVVREIPILLPKKISDEFSFKKWSDWNVQENLSKDDSYYEEHYVRGVFKYLQRFIESKGRFLEIGVGSGFVAMELAKRGFEAFGVDISLDALIYAKERFRENGLELAAVCGDIRCMPFKDNIFNLNFGGGVIEHFERTELVVAELRRCMARGGATLQCVPAFSFSTMTYGQLWGGIPNFPLVEQFFKFIHLNILKGKHMIFGLEKLFTLRQLQNVMLANNLNIMESGIFDIYRPLNFIKNQRLKIFANKIMQYRLFCHMLYVIAEKGE